MNPVASLRFGVVQNLKTDPQSHLSTGRIVWGDSGKEVQVPFVAFNSEDVSGVEILIPNGKGQHPDTATYRARPSGDYLALRFPNYAQNQLAKNTIIEDIVEIAKQHCVAEKKTSTFAQAHDASIPALLAFQGALSESSKKV